MAANTAVLRAATSSLALNFCLYLTFFFFLTSPASWARGRRHEPEVICTPGFVLPLSRSELVLETSSKFSVRRRLRAVRW